MRKEEVIYLFNEDLNKQGKRQDFDKRNYASFLISSLSKEDYVNANLIIYICTKHYPRYKVIKSRHF